MINNEFLECNSIVRFLFSNQGNVDPNRQNVVRIGMNVHRYSVLDVGRRYGMSLRRIDGLQNRAHVSVGQINRKTAHSTGRSQVDQFGEWFFDQLVCFRLIRYSPIVKFLHCLQDVSERVGHVFARLTQHAKRAPFAQFGLYFELYLFFQVDDVLFGRVFVDELFRLNRLEFKACHVSMFAEKRLPMFRIRQVIAYSKRLVKLLYIKPHLINEEKSPIFYVNLVRLQFFLIIYLVRTD